MYENEKGGFSGFRIGILGSPWGSVVDFHHQPEGFVL